MIENGFDWQIDKIFELLAAVHAGTDYFAAQFNDDFPCPTALQDYLDRLGSLPGSQFLVASDGDEGLGFLFVEPRAARKLQHTADLTMGVVVEARSRGVGRELLDTVFPLLQSEGVIENLYLMVRADNAPARRLYENSGFATLAILARDTKVGERYFDGVLMRKFLAD